MSSIEGVRGAITRNEEGSKDEDGHGRCETCKTLALAREPLVTILKLFTFCSSSLKI